MATRDQGRMRIGEVLKSTRTRQGLDIRTVEERTKIRTKYLRALEGEDWEVLPSSAYAKGFLRTYGQLLGLDAEAIVDEYRRQVEVGERPDSPLATDRILERRRRIGERRESPRLGLLIGAAVAAGFVFLLVLGLTGGADEDAERSDRAERREARQERQERQRRRERRDRQAQAGEPVRMRMVVDADVRICLLGDGPRPLIDGQILPAGREESFQAQQFRLRFPSGFDPAELRVFLNGERRRLPDGDGPVSYRISGPQQIRPGPEPGPGCP